MHQVKISNFEGPFDLLLQLIEQEEMDISQISLAHVTEQYLRTLEKAENIPADELADFLVIAAKLLLIKSRILLPQMQVEGAEEATELERQLKIFKEYLEASRGIAKIIHKRRFTFGRGKPAMVIEEEFSPPPSLTAATMRELFLGVLREIEPIIALPKAVVERTVSIAEKIEAIRALILDKAIVSFQSVMGSAKSRTDVIISFLAVLELVKQRTVMVTQNVLFHDISIKRIDTLPEV